MGQEWSLNTSVVSIISLPYQRNTQLFTFSSQKSVIKSMLLMNRINISKGTIRMTHKKRNGDDDDETEHETIDYG